MRYSASWAVAWLLLRVTANAGDVDAVSFGAVADGVTDSTRAIQAAIDAAADAGGGAGVLPGAKAPYLVRDTIRVRGSGIEIRGHGARILLADGAFNGSVKYVLLVSGSEDTPSGTW